MWDWKWMQISRATVIALCVIAFSVLGWRMIPFFFFFSGTIVRAKRRNSRSSNESRIHSTRCLVLLIRWARVVRLCLSFRYSGWFGRVRRRHDRAYAHVLWNLFVRHDRKGKSSSSSRATRNQQVHMVQQTFQPQYTKTTFSKASIKRHIYFTVIDHKQLSIVENFITREYYRTNNQFGIVQSSHHDRLKSVSTEKS